MKITATGGTDGANIVLFWPDNLPENADKLLRRDPIDLIESLRDKGKAIWFLCEGDGEYSVSIYLDTTIPDDLLAVCTDEERYPKLVVSGDGYFGGMEYMFKKDRRLLDKYPHMCEMVAIPNGIFSATVYRTDVPESLEETWLVKHAGQKAMRLWDLHSWIAAASVISVIVAALCFFVVPLIAWFCIFGVTIIICGSAIGLSKTKAYKAVANAQREFELAYPAYVVHL